jgi:hypothetical protein
LTRYRTGDDGAFKELPRLHVSGQQLAVAAVGHPDLTQPGAPDEAREYAVGVDVALAGDRLLHGGVPRNSGPVV